MTIEQLDTLIEASKKRLKQRQNSESFSEYAMPKKKRKDKEDYLIRRGVDKNKVKRMSDDSLATYFDMFKRNPNKKESLQNKQTKRHLLDTIREESKTAIRHMNLLFRAGQGRKYNEVISHINEILASITEIDVALEARNLKVPSRLSRGIKDIVYELEDIKEQAENAQSDPERSPSFRPSSQKQQLKRVLKSIKKFVQKQKVRHKQEGVRGQIKLLHEQLNMTIEQLDILIEASKKRLKQRQNSESFSEGLKKKDDKRHLLNTLRGAERDGEKLLKRADDAAASSKYNKMSDYLVDFVSVFDDYVVDIFKMYDIDIPRPLQRDIDSIFRDANDLERDAADAHDDYDSNPSFNLTSLIRDYKNVIRKLTRFAKDLSIMKESILELDTLIEASKKRLQEQDVDKRKVQNLLRSAVKHLDSAADDLEKIHGLKGVSKNRNFSRLVFKTIVAIESVQHREMNSTSREAKKL